MINEFGYGSEEITIEIYARIARNYRICKDKKNANIFADKGVAISDQLLKEGQWVGEAFLEKFELLVSEEKNMEACKFIQEKLDKQTFVEKYRELSSKILVCKKLIKLYRNMNKKEEEKHNRCQGNAHFLYIFRDCFHEKRNHVAGMIHFRNDNRYIGAFSRINQSQNEY